MGKDTVVIGASPSEEKYGYKATVSLKRHGHKVYPVGIKAGKIEDLDIITERPLIQNVDTITLYVGPKNQDGWKDYIYSLKPKRIVFNPGTENETFEKELRAKGIETIEACTLVMLSIGNY